MSKSNIRKSAEAEAAKRGAVIHVERSECVSGKWYAAFRTPDSDEDTPELGWGYGDTQDAALAEAHRDFRRVC